MLKCPSESGRYSMINEQTEDSHGVREAACPRGWGR